jgi:hypothetical protein
MDIEGSPVVFLHHVNVSKKELPAAYAEQLPSPIKLETDE